MLQVSKLSSPLFPDVSFDAKPGECICLYGESGVGKTRLLRAIADLDDNQGDIRLNKHYRHELPAHQWRNQVTLVSAESAWWSKIVIDHFNGIEPDFTLLGLSDQIGQWFVANLSTGERQRLSLLRALHHHPSVLLLDEITANLDPESTLKVESLLKQKMHDGLIVIWVTHDAQQRDRMASRTYRIESQCVIEVD